jgi:hypothetical protein
MPVRLIVNADDFGLTPGVSQGILAAHRQGMVTSTTALMNMPGVETALLQAREFCPKLGLGVHLVLSAGRPLLPPASVPSLTSATQKFYPLKELLGRLDEINMAEVRAEWQAQIGHFIEVLGLNPDHLDAHHHCSYLHPGLFETLLELAGGLGCPIRMPFIGHTHSILGDLSDRQSEQMRQAAPHLLQRYTPVCPQNFLPSFFDHRVSTAALRLILENLPQGTSELMCHPGHSDALLLASSSYNIQRQRELDTLTDADVMTQLPGWGIELSNFAQLR